jgi:hypothetical protein
MKTAQINQDLGASLDNNCLTITVRGVARTGTPSNSRSALEYMQERCPTTAERQEQLLRVWFAWGRDS